MTRRDRIIVLLGLAISATISIAILAGGLMLVLHD